MVDIRPARHEDCSAIRDVHVRSVRGSPAHDSDAKGIDNWLSKKTLDDYEADMKATSFVIAEDGDQIVGFGAIDIGKATVTSVFVDPQYARKGIGRAILKELESMARTAGLKVVSLQAAGPAINFYQKVGYTGDARGEMEPSWMEMSKDLS